MENWRGFLKEEKGSLGQQTLTLLPMLINMKKFKDVDDFLVRSKFIKMDDRGLVVQYVLKIDDQIAGTVTYDRVKKGCSPTFKKGKQPKGTMMLMTIARDPAFKGWGVGRLISFLSACDINSMGLSITSDRNTSDKAGKQLVNTLKMMGANESEPFDYVGWFVSAIETTYMYKGKIDSELVPYAPEVYSSDREGVKGQKADNKEQRAYVKVFKPMIKKLLDHLRPMTPEKDDDCPPSSNIVFGGESIIGVLKGHKFLDLAAKFLEMDNKQVNDFFNSDKRVQGYTFTMPEMMLDAAQQIIKAIDVSSELSDNQLDITSQEADTVFSKVYSTEIGDLGRAVAEQTKKSQANLITENWRRYISEAALGMGSGGISELGDMNFEIAEYGNGYIIYALSGDGEELGEVQLDSQFYKNCGIFMTHSEILNPEVGSFGPFLYDLAIELGSWLGTGVTSSDSPSGLDDRDSGSSKEYAINVWLYYFKRRKDIDKHPITCTAMIKSRNLPYIDGNYAYKAYPDHEYRHVHKGHNKRDAAKSPPQDIQDKVNAINHFYRKDAVLLNKLKDAGKLDDNGILF